MSMLVEYERLFKPYSKDGHTVTAMLNYLNREGARLGIPQELSELAVQETFAFLAGGGTFPTDKCPCGCGIDKSGTAIVHHTLKVAIELNKVRLIQYTTFLQDRFNTIILEHMHRENEDFTAQYMKPGIVKRIVAKLRRKKNEETAVV